MEIWRYPVSSKSERLKILYEIPVHSGLNYITDWVIAWVLHVGLYNIYNSLTCD